MAMGEFEEETYSTVFTALRHPVRRRLLRVLSQGSRTFTDLQSSFKVNGAVLTYHLDAMKDLICKTEDGKYSLSTMGEGAIALMERVEDPPKLISTKPSHKNSRRLSILLSATICIAVILLVSGTYLTSIPSVQTFYDVPAGWSVTHYFDWDFYEIDGNLYDVRYSLFVNPPNQLLNQLTKEHEADVYVNLKTNGTVETWFYHYTNEALNQFHDYPNEALNQTTKPAPSALYYVTLTYSEYSSVDNMYHQKQQTSRGEFQPVESPRGLAFSTHITLPHEYPANQNEALPENIRINIWTNTTLRRDLTDEIMTDFIGVKASAETRPYESQGNIITIIGIILVAAALMMTILPLLRKQT